jgi:glutamyl-tRNA reductase
MDLLVLGANHKTAPAEIRDEIQMDPEEMASFYFRLREHRLLIPELAVLSTCNRTEFYAVVRDREAADQFFRAAIESEKGVPHLSNGKYTYSWTGRETVRQLFRVAAGVDSLMVGEPQILGQVKEAFDLADRNQAAGALMTRLFNSAIHVGKRARTETEIGKGTVSVAYAAVEMTLKILDRLERHPVLVVGAGETGALAVKHFAEAKPQRLTVVNRTLERAEELAEAVGGQARRWEELDQALAEARVVVTATSAKNTLIDVRRMERVLKRNRRGPMVLVDISNPRNIDPGVGNLERVFLYDLDALESIAEQNRARRDREIPKVEGIVGDEVGKFMAWYDSLEVVPVIKALRGRFEDIAAQEIKKHAKNFMTEDQEALEQFTRSLLNKLLHQPTAKIRGVEQASPHGIHKLVAIQELFRLNVEEYGEGGSADPPEGPGTEEEEPAGEAAGEDLPNADAAAGEDPSRSEGAPGKDPLNPDTGVGSDGRGPTDGS